MFLKKSAILILTLVLAVAFSFSAIASTEIRLSVTSDGVIVSGLTENPDSQVIIAVFPKAEEGSENTPDKLVALVQSKTGAGGIFECLVPIGYSVSSGDYTVEVSTSGVFDSVVSADFYFLSQSDIEIITDKFNNASTAAQLEELCQSFAAEINLDYEGLFKIALSADDVYKKMLAEKNETGFENSSDIKTAFDRAGLMSALENASDNAENYAGLIRENAGIIGIDAGKFTDEELIGISKIIKDDDLTTISDLKEAFAKAEGPAKFNLASRSEVEDLIEEYSEFISLPSEYKKSTSSAAEKRLSLYKKIENKTNFKTYDDISDFIDDFYDSYSAPSSGGNGGGSKGGGSSKTTSVVQITSGAADSVPVTDSTSQLTAAVNFEDLQGFDWALEAIEALANSKVISGVNSHSYEPARSITREEFVKMIVVAFEISSSSDITFTDVPYNAWYRPYVESACGAGLVEGMGDGSFGTGKEITRQEMAVIMSRILKSEGVDAGSDLSKTFSDSASIASWAADAVDIMTSNGILNGVSETEFAPDMSVNRAMAAKAVYGLMQFIENREESVK